VAKRRVSGQMLKAARMQSSLGGYSTTRLQPAADCLLAFSSTSSVRLILLHGVPGSAHGLNIQARELEDRHGWSRVDTELPDFGPQEGRGPVQAGSASHSAHRIRRSSSPTLTKTKAASSLPVFDPANMAGTPYAFLTVALLAIAIS
jgi:hypothetical protein